MAAGRWDRRQIKDKHFNTDEYGGADGIIDDWADLYLSYVMDSKEVTDYNTGPVIVDEESVLDGWTEEGEFYIYKDWHTALSDNGIEANNIVKWDTDEWYCDLWNEAERTVLNEVKADPDFEEKHGMTVEEWEETTPDIWDWLCENYVDEIDEQVSWDYEYEFNIDDPRSEVGELEKRLEGFFSCQSGDDDNYYPPLVQKEGGYEAEVVDLGFWSDSEVQERLKSKYGIDEKVIDEVRIITHYQNGSSQVYVDRRSKLFETVPIDAPFGLMVAEALIAQEDPKQVVQEKDLDVVAIQADAVKSGVPIADVLA